MPEAGLKGKRAGRGGSGAIAETKSRFSPAEP